MNRFLSWQAALWAAMLIVGWWGASRSVWGDAMVVTRAMLASTIAEVFVERGEVRVELEIGAADVKAFENVLPEELYDKLFDEKVTEEERQKKFLEQEWLITADDVTLPGSIEQVVLVKRLVRDEVTGQPLVEQPEDAEVVVRVALRYKLEGEPPVISIRPPLDEQGGVKANVGFVCYHAGLPLNDFRYLAGEVTADLDWEDPWYSQFRHRNFRRQFDAPMSVFLYVEPYEVRKEIIVRPQDLQQWVDLGIAGAETIAVDEQDAMKRNVAEFLGSKSPVMVDGEEVEGRLERIHFIRRSLRQTGIVEPPEELNSTSATLGVIFVYPIAKLPERVSLEWDLFSEKIQEVPGVTADEAGGLPSMLTLENRVLEWENFLTNPTESGLVAIAEPSKKAAISVPVISVLCGGVMALMLVSMFRQRGEGRVVSRRAILAVLGVFVCGVVTLPSVRVVIANPFVEEASLNESEVAELMEGLLYNVYRAFDHHDESVIYDRLAQSIEGSLLADVYLKTRRSMEVKNQGGLRVTVKEVEVQELNDLERSEEGGLNFVCRWRVAGSIGHWGHIHKRENENLAEIVIAPREGQWKIVGMEMLDEQTAN